MHVSVHTNPKKYIAIENIEFKLIPLSTLISTVSKIVFEKGDNETWIVLQLLCFFHYYQQ